MWLWINGQLLPNLLAMVEEGNKKWEKGEKKKEKEKEKEIKKEKVRERETKRWSE